MSIEIPPALQWVSYLAGSKWPQGDEDGLWRIGEHWHASATEMSDLIPDLNRVRNETMSVITGETADKAEQEFALLFDGDYSVDKLVDAMSALGEMARQAGTQLEASKIEILVGLAMSAAEILYAIAMAPWTFGASMAWIPPIEALTIAAIRTLFNQLLRALVRKAVEALAKTTVSRLVRAAAKEGVEEIAQELITNLAIQQYQVDKGHKDKIDWNDVGNAAKGAAAGGAAAGLFHGPAFAALGGKHGHGGIGNAFAGAGASYGAEVVAGVAGALAAGSNLNAGEIFAGGVLGGLSGGIESSHGHGDGEHGEGGPHGAPVGLDGGKSHAFDPDDKGTDDKGTDDKGTDDKSTDDKSTDDKSTDDKGFDDTKDLDGTDRKDNGDFGYPDALPAYLRHDPDGSPPSFEQHQSDGMTRDGASESTAGGNHTPQTSPSGATSPQPGAGAEGSAQGGPQHLAAEGQAGQPVAGHDSGSGQHEQTSSPLASRDGSSSGSASHAVEHGSPSGEPPPSQSAVTTAEHQSGGADSGASSVQRDSQPAQISSQTAEHATQHPPADARHTPVSGTTDTSPMHSNSPSPTSPTSADAPPAHGQGGLPNQGASSPDQAPHTEQSANDAAPQHDAPRHDGVHDSDGPPASDHPSHVDSAAADSRGEPSRPSPSSAESDAAAPPLASTASPASADPAAPQPPTSAPVDAGVAAPPATAAGSTPSNSSHTAAIPSPSNTGTATSAPNAATTPATTNPANTNPSSNPAGVSNPGGTAKPASAGLGASTSPAPTAVSNTAGHTASPSSSRSTTDDQTQLAVGMVPAPPIPSADTSGGPKVARGGSSRPSRKTPDHADAGPVEAHTDSSADPVSSLVVSGLPDGPVGDVDRVASDEPKSTNGGVRDVLPTSTQTAHDVRGWIGDVNHDGDASVPPAGERLTNCGPTTWVVFDRLSGIDSFGRAHSEQLRAQDVGDATGLPLRGSDTDGIAAQLRDAGAGAHTVVVAQFDNGVAHSFNALFDGEQVWAVDGQHGTVTAWPPDLDRPGNPVTNWYVGTPADRALDGAPFDRHDGNAHGDLTVTGNGSSHPVATAAHPDVTDTDDPVTSAALTPFDSKSKQLNAAQRTQLDGLADDLVDRARQLHDDGRGGLSVRAEGGGNGGRRSKGPDVVGRQRAGAALDYLRAQVQQRLEDLRLSSGIITVSKEPTSRGTALRPDLVGSDADRRRTVVLSAHERPAALDRATGDPDAPPTPYSPPPISEAERKEVLGRLAAGDVVSLVHAGEVGQLAAAEDTVRDRLRESFPDRHDHVDEDLANMVALLENSRITINFRIDESLADMLSEDGERATSGETSQNIYLNGWERGPLDGVAELRDSAERRTGQYGGHEPDVGHESADVVAARQRINNHLTRESADYQPSARPRYGALDYARSTTGAAPGYGRSFVVLKEHVKHRATFTANDSMQGNPHGTTVHGMAQLLARTQDDDFRRIHQLATTGQGFDRAKERHGTDFSKDQNYLEAQLHMPIDFFRDVEAVSVDVDDTRGLDLERQKWVRSQLAEYGEAYGVRIELRNIDGVIIPDLAAARAAARAAQASGSGAVPAPTTHGAHDEARPPRDDSDDDDSDVVEWSDDERSELQDDDDPEVTGQRHGSASPTEDALSDSSSIFRGFVSGLPDSHGVEDVRPAGEHAHASSSGGGVQDATNTGVDRSGGSLYLPFDRGAKGVAAEHDQRIAAFADGVVADARRRLEEGRPAAALHVRGGGNGGLLSRGGADAVGMQRAVAARAVLQREIQARLEREDLPARLVSFPEPTTRGAELTDDIPGTDPSSRRRVVEAHIGDQEPATAAPEPVAHVVEQEPATPAPQPVDGDGFVVDADGVRHWGLYGASGLLLRARGFDGAPMVLLQRRAQWSDQGGTWGLPGGARNLDESVEQAALRETQEETGIQGDRVGVRAQLVTNRAPGIDWTYSTVIGDAPYPLRAVSNGEGALRWVPVEEVAGLELHPGLRDSWDGLRSQLDDHPMPPARPSAQLDHTINLLKAGDRYGTNNAEQAIHYRDDDELLYREDDRPPEVIFQEGFGVHPEYRDNGDIAHFISTSRNPHLGFLRTPSEGRRVYRYTIDAPGGVDVNRTVGIDPEAYQQEISFPGGIRRENILSAVEILPPAGHPVDGTGPGPARYGPEAINEHFNPNLPNDGAPPLFQGAIGGRHDLDDVQSVSSEGTGSEIDFRRGSDSGDETDDDTRSVSSEHGGRQDERDHDPREAGTRDGSGASPVGGTSGIVAQPGHPSSSANPTPAEAVWGVVSGLPTDGGADIGLRHDAETHDGWSAESRGTRSALPISALTRDDVQHWIGDLNNDGDAQIPPVGERLTNCGPTTLTVFDRLSEIPSFGRAHPVQLRAEDVGDATGLSLRAVDADGLAEQLRGAGAGAHTVVVAQFGNGLAHSFNALFDGDGVWAIDGQHGTITAWPPALGRPNNPVTNWYAGTATPRPADVSLGETPVSGLGDHQQPAPHAAAESRTTQTGRTGDAETRRLHVPFDRQAKEVSAQHDDRITDFATEVVAEARRRHDAGQPGVAVAVEGGGNGGRRGDGADAVGVLRAQAVVDAIRPQVKTLLRQGGLPNDLVTFTSPTTRGKALPEDVPGADKNGRRRTVVARIEDQDPPESELIASQDDSGFPLTTSADDPVTQRNVLGMLAAGDVVGLQYAEDVAAGDGWKATLQDRLRDELGIADPEQARNDLEKMIAALENSRVTVNFDANKWFAEFVANPDNPPDAYLNSWERGIRPGGEHTKGVLDSVEQSTGGYSRVRHGLSVGDEQVDAARARIQQYLSDRGSDDFVASGRPRYGAVDYSSATAGPAEGYGKSFLVVREHVKHCALFLSGDSFARPGLRATTYSHIGKVLTESTQGQLRGLHQHATTGGRGPVTAGQGVYFEAQLYTPVRFDRDVAEVNLDMSELSSIRADDVSSAIAALRQFTDSQGVDLVVRQWNPTLSLPFEEGSKTVHQDEHRVLAFTREVVKMAVARSAAGSHGLEVHVDGGGNGNIVGRGATASGRQRAGAVRDAIRSELDRELPKWGVSRDFVSISEPTSRGRALGSEVTGGRRDARRRVDVRVEERTEPAADVVAQPASASSASPDDRGDGIVRDTESQAMGSTDVLEREGTQAPSRSGTDLGDDQLLAPPARGDVPAVAEYTDVVDVPLDDADHVGGTERLEVESGPEPELEREPEAEGDVADESDVESDAESVYFSAEEDLGADVGRGLQREPEAEGDVAVKAETTSDSDRDAGSHIDAEASTQYGLFDGDDGDDGDDRQSEGAEHEPESASQTRPQARPESEEKVGTESASESDSFGPEGGEKGPGEDPDAPEKEPESSTDDETESDPRPKAFGAESNLGKPAATGTGAYLDARGAHASTSTHRGQGLPIAAPSGDASRPATPSMADTTRSTGNDETRTDFAHIVETHGVQGDSAEEEPQSQKERERVAKERRAEEDRVAVQESGVSRQDDVAAHVHRAVEEAVGSRDRGDVEQGGAGTSGHQRSWWQRAWHATSMYEDVAHHGDQHFWNLLETLTDPATDRPAIADMRTAMVDLQARIDAGSALPHDHPLAGDADVKRAYRVMRSNAGPLVGSALESFSVLAAAPDRSWQGRAEAALTALFMAGVLGAPYTVPVLEGDPNYTALLISAHAKIVPRLVGLAAYPRVNRRLFWEYARDAPLLWLSELPYLAEMRHPQLEGALPPDPVNGGAPDRGSGSDAEPERIPDAASTAWVAGNTLFAVGAFVGLGYGPSLWRGLADLRPDQRALASGGLPLPSRDHLPAESGPLSREEFSEHVTRAANGLQVVLEAQRAFQAAGGRLSVNLAAQIGHAAEDVGALQELASRLNRTPQDSVSLRSWAATGWSTETNPDRTKKLGFVIAHAIPHSVAIAAGWTLNAPSGGSATADYFYAGVLRAIGAMMDPHASAEEAKEIFNNLTSELLGNTPIDAAVIAYHSATGRDFWENPAVQWPLAAYLGVFSATYAGWTGERIADGVGHLIEHPPNPGATIRRFGDYVRQGALWIPGRGTERAADGPVADAPSVPIAATASLSDDRVAPAEVAPLAHDQSPEAGDHRADHELPMTAPTPTTFEHAAASSVSTDEPRADKGKRAATEAEVHRWQEEEEQHARQGDFDELMGAYRDQQSAWHAAAVTPDVAARHGREGRHATAAVVLSEAIERLEGLSDAYRQRWGVDPMAPVTADEDVSDRFSARHAGIASIVDGQGNSAHAGVAAARPSTGGGAGLPVAGSRSERRGVSARRASS